MKIFRQKGFTLVELMVAMTIGTLVILGAGQLFITTMNTFQEVKEISRKQETVVFAAHTMANAYRRGSYEYVFGDGADSDSCAIKRVSNEEPVVDGLYKDESCDDASFNNPNYDGVVGFHEFTLRFPHGEDNDPEELVFHVMNRSRAINPQ